MRKIYRAYAAYQKKYGAHTRAGINFIRGAINFFNSRPEANNESKGPIRLLMDYSEYVLANKDTPVIKAEFKKPLCTNTESNLPPIN